MERRSGHVCGSLSCLDMILAVLTHTTRQAADDEDLLVLSKGHAAPALYAALVVSDLLPRGLDLRRLGSPLEGHPRRDGVPTVEVSTGSLGHGIAFAVGAAIASPARNVFCIASDAEMQAGITYESMRVAARLSLPNLAVMVDHNGFQTDGRLSGDGSFNELAAMGALGMKIAACNGHDPAELEEVISQAVGAGPALIDCRTTRGYGFEGLLGTGEIYGEEISDELGAALLQAAAQK